MNNECLVSVVISTYNGSSTIWDTIEHIENQTHNNIEIIIIDDASNDKTHEIISSLQKKYNNIAYIKNKFNLERSISRNLWIAEASGNFIAFCDDDDLRVDKRKLDKQIKLLEQTWCDICGTYFDYLSKNTITSWPKLPHTSNQIKSIILKYNPFCYSSVIWKREIFEKYKFDNKYIWTEDYSLWLKVCSYYKPCILTESCVRYKLPQNNNRTKHGIKMILNSFVIILPYYRIYPNFLKWVLYKFMDLLYAIKNIIYKTV